MLLRNFSLRCLEWPLECKIGMVLPSCLPSLSLNFLPYKMEIMVQSSKSSKPWHTWHCSDHLISICLSLNFLSFPLIISSLSHSLSHPPCLLAPNVNAMKKLFFFTLRLNNEWPKWQINILIFKQLI